MIHDLEPFSHFSEPFDSVNVLSGSPSAGNQVEGQIINMLMPKGLQGEVYNRIGDHFTYRISTATSKRYGDLKYGANAC